MKTTKSVVIGALATAIALSLAACGTKTQPTTPTSAAPGSSSAAPTGDYMGGEIKVRGCTPQNPLFGGMTQEVCGGYILDYTSSQLVYYDNVKALPNMDLAESITPNADSTVFTVKLVQGRKFSDGTEVKAQNFISSWNYEAYGPNGFAQSFFLQPIAGFDAMQCGTDADGNAVCDTKPPTATTLSGLKLIDDYNFTITMASPTSNMIVRLGYPAFQPLPDSFFEDIKADPVKAAAGQLDAQGKIPVQAGPYMVTDNTATDIVLQKNPNYTGPTPGHVDKVTFHFYDDSLTAAYNDVMANNLDFIDTIPVDLMAGEQWINQLGKDRTVMIAGPTIQAIDFSPNDPQLKDVNIRKAISEAIDRDTITKTLFNGAREPLRDWVPPFIDGYDPNGCGEACVYDEAKAKADYAKTAGYKGTMQLSVNAGASHEIWAKAVCNNLNTVLGIDCQVNIVPKFATLLDQVAKGELQGMFRAGWAMDYPSMENYLGPIYGTGAQSNGSKYSNKAFDDKLVEAAAAPDLASANKLYREAINMLAKDLPAVPVWYYNSCAAWSNRVTNVIVTPMGYADLTQIQVLPGK